MGGIVWRLPLLDKVKNQPQQTFKGGSNCASAARPPARGLRRAGPNRRAQPSHVGRYRAGSLYACPRTSSPRDNLTGGSSLDGTSHFRRTPQPSDLRRRCGCISGRQACSSS